MTWSKMLRLHWREANVVPIFKKGDRSKPANYRPVSLTAICCKQLEHIIVSNTLQHLNDHNILTDNSTGSAEEDHAKLNLS